MRLLRRLLLVIAVGCVLFGIVAWRFIHTQLPQRTGEQRLNALTQPVTVRFDQWGIPHIDAAHEGDALRALGYVHAQDRLFQMDLMRRVAQGRLAELVGAKALDSDRLFRTLGVRDMVRRYGAQIESESSPTQAAVLAYLDGINQFIAQRRWPVEYTILGAEPKRFDAADAASIAGLLAYSFAQGFQEDPLVDDIATRLGAPYLKDLVFNGPSDKAGSVVHELPLRPDAQAHSDPLLAFTHLVAEVNAQLAIPQLQGSNSWMIASRLAEHGKPLLANDPHIGFSAPSAWYEAHIETPQWNVYGHFLAGIPFPLLIHTAHHATGLTMWENDEIDFFRLKAHPTHADIVKERGRWIRLGYRDEQIGVKGGNPVTLRVKSTGHGPLVNSLYPAAGATPIAIRWNYLDPRNRPLHAFYAISHARNFSEMEHAASMHWSPGLNLSYADADGNIAMWAIGRQVVRPAQLNSHRILDGSSPSESWMGVAPFSTNPRFINPSSGVIFSANQPYPSGNPLAHSVEIDGYYPPPDRARILADRLRAPGKPWTLAMLSDIQTDIRNPSTAALCKSWGQALHGQPLSKIERDALQLVLAWDGQYALDSSAATICQRWQATLVEQLFQPPLGALQWKAAKRLFLIERSLPRISENAQSPWWGKQPDARRQALKKSYVAAVRALVAQFGESSENWRWGRLHQLTHPHLLGRHKIFAPLFNIGPFPIAGGREAVNNQYSMLSDRTATVIVGPSTRRLIDLADTRGAVGINPTGQSGVLFDRHRRDQAQLYVDHRYRPMWSAKTDVNAHLASTLILRP